MIKKEKRNYITNLKYIVIEKIPRKLSSKTKKNKRKERKGEEPYFDLKFFFYVKLLGFNLKKKQKN